MSKELWLVLSLTLVLSLFYYGVLMIHISYKDNKWYERRGIFSKWEEIQDKKRIIKRGKKNDRETSANMGS